MSQFRKSFSGLFLSLVASAALADVTLLNASYDVARDVYKAVSYTHLDVYKRQDVD